MIKNLVVSGCSFTDDYDGKTWPYYIADNIKDCRVYNLSFPGAGNFYIADIGSFDGTLEKLIKYKLSLISFIF